MSDHTAKSQYPATYSYLYRLVSELGLTQLRNIDYEDRSQVLNLFVKEAPRYELEAMTNGDHVMKTSLALSMLGADKSNVDEIREDTVFYFWSNILYLIEYIFDEAEADCHARTGAEPDYLEHMAIDNNERARDMNAVIQSRLSSYSRQKFK